jgi:hypothetical protein
MARKNNDAHKSQEMTEAEAKSLLSNPAYKEALALFANDIVLNGAKSVRAQIAELKVFDPISDGYNNCFNKFERNKGELFVPVRRGWPQPNVVTNPNPNSPAVVQVNKVLVENEEVSFGSLVHRQFPKKDFDGYDLYSAKEGSDMHLAPLSKAPSVTILRDSMRKALAVLSRSR